MDFKKLVEEKLKNHENRLKHTFGVYNRSLELAKLYKVNLENLKIASLLHDITKHENDQYHLNKINDKSITNYYPKPLWHAFSAYVYAKELGVNEETCNMIKHHVYGKINMSLDLMILIVSDYCEENRVHKQAKIAYNKALIDINDAYLYIAEETIKYLKSKNITPIKEQLEVYEYYIKKGKDK